ncbi:MAG: hypothetical protein FWC19_04025 [Treponema sp.]|nr:hypothetical protein [Treponema sp.]
MSQNDKFCPNCGSVAGSAGAPQSEKGTGGDQGSAVISPHKSSLGLDANIASAIIFAAVGILSWIPYLGYAAWIVPLVFFFMEKESKFVKFSSVTALVIGIISVAISIVFAIIALALTPRSLESIINFAMSGRSGILIFFSTLAIIIAIAFTALFIFLAFMAYSYKQVKLPIVGPIAAKAAEKLDNIKSGS